ncbi:unnamed protein product, partial [Meganyctiphanes norvegica]
GPTDNNTSTTTTTPTLSAATNTIMYSTTATATETMKTTIPYHNTPATTTTTLVLPPCAEGPKDIMKILKCYMVKGWINMSLKLEKSNNCSDSETVNSTLPTTNYLPPN